MGTNHQKQNIRSYNFLNLDADSSSKRHFADTVGIPYSYVVLNAFESRNIGLAQTPLLVPSFTRMIVLDIRKW